MGRLGEIRLLDLDTGQVAETPYLTIPGVSTLSSEGGLLGLAFHPDYEENGLGYAHYTVPGGAFENGLSVVARFRRDPDNPDRALLSSLDPILSFSQPQGNHNGGWIGFSPTDNHLYIATGDGGGGNDNGANHTPGIGNSQDITNNLLGKILRIDVDGDDFPDDASRDYAIPADNPFVGVAGDDEIWAYGLRNPFRASFDRQTGDLWIGDVGQNLREEIDFQPDGVGGVNYGWRLREGTIATPTGGVGGPRPDGAVDPVYDYSAGFGDFRGDSVTGGVVYRGPDPELQGTYFFADFSDSNYWRFDPDDPAGTVDNINAELSGDGAINNPVAFAEDTVGNLYFITFGGDVFRIETDALVAGDFNADGVVDVADYTVWRDGLETGEFQLSDYGVWRDNFGATAAGASAAIVPEPAAWLLVAGGLALAVGRRPGER